MRRSVAEIDNPVCSATPLWGIFSQFMKSVCLHACRRTYLLACHGALAGVTNLRPDNVPNFHKHTNFHTRLSHHNMGDWCSDVPFYFRPNKDTLIFDMMEQLEPCNCYIPLYSWYECDSVCCSNPCACVLVWLMRPGDKLRPAQVFIVSSICPRLARVVTRTCRREPLNVPAST